MPAYEFGLTASASSTVEASPAPTATTARLTTPAGFYEQTVVQFKVGGVFQDCILYTINTGTGDVTFSPLTGPPDTGGLSACEDRGELLVNWKFNTYRTAILDLATSIANQFNIFSIDNDPAFGNGRDGYFYLGSITNPTGANTPTIAVVPGASGYINGATVSVKIAAQNMSGETIATAASNVLSVTNGQIDVTIPPWASANISSYKIFLSYNGVTYFYTAVSIGDGFNAAAGTTYRLNSPLTSGAAPVGVNSTSGAPITLSGVFRCTYAHIKATDQISGTVASGKPFVLLATKDIAVDAGAQILYSAVGGLTNPAWYTGTGVGPTFTWGNGTNAGQPPWGTGFPAAAQDFLFSSGHWRWLGSQGGANTNHAGGTVYIAAGGFVKFYGQVFASGSALGTTGPAGGLICIVAGKGIDRQGCTMSANGATAINNNGSGGGGIIALISNIILGTPAVQTVNGGAASGGGGGLRFGGGGFGGNGGARSVAPNGPGSPGAAGLVFNLPLNQVSLPRW